MYGNTDTGRHDVNPRYRISIRIKNIHRIKLVEIFCFPRHIDRDNGTVGKSRAAAGSRDSNIFRRRGFPLRLETCRKRSDKFHLCRQRFHCIGVDK